MSRYPVICIWAAIAISIFVGVDIQAQVPQLTVHVSYVYADSAGPGPIGVEVFVEHPYDSIAGFELYLKIDSSLPARFQMLNEDQPAYCLDGSPLSNFEFLTVKSLHGDGTDIKIVGLAEGNFQPPFLRGFGPGNQRIIYLELRPLGGADLVPQPFKPIQVDPSPGDFGFSTPEGFAIGITNGQLDTNLVKFDVEALNGLFSGCAAMGDVDGNGVTLALADYLMLNNAIQGKGSITGYEFMGDFNGDSRVDSADVSLYRRYFQFGLSVLMPYPRPTSCYQTLVPCCEGHVGNIDCDPNQGVDISDLTAMVQNLFVLISEPCCFGEADIDRNGGIDITDLTLLIDALFISLTPLPNCPLVGAGPLRTISCGQ